MLRIMSNSLWRALLVAGLAAFGTMALAAEPPLAGQATEATPVSANAVLPKPRKLKLHRVAKKKTTHHLAGQNPKPQGPDRATAAIAQTE